MDSLAPLAGEIRSAASDGMPVFFAGTATELLGAAITDSSGATFDGIGLADLPACRVRAGLSKTSTVRRTSIPKPSWAL